MNGTLITGSHTASGKVVTLASSMDTPVTPPSMKLLERRNLAAKTFHGWWFGDE